METAEIDGCHATPVPSQDWPATIRSPGSSKPRAFGSSTVGDTIWHGSWYAIHARFPSFDVAFLPINAVLARLDGFTPTEVPTTMTPEQAIEAAVVLQADLACALHYDLFNNPPR